MNKPIKRLEIIRNAIELEDDDIVQSQLPRLKLEAHDDALRAIVLALELRHYGDAIAAITSWLQSQRALTHWQDPRIAASKLELKALENELRGLIDRRHAHIQRLDEFNDLYLTRLGPLMSEILRLRKVLADAMLRRKLAGLDDGYAADAGAEYQAENASRDYESYRQRQQEAEKRRERQQQMAESERRELKRLWRQASKLCHPDLVDAALKEEANDLMVQLNQARQKGDLPTVRAILARLSHGQQPMMSSERLNDVERLRRRIADIRQQIIAMQAELAGLEKEGAWQLVSSLRDPEAYFQQQTSAMQHTLRTLEQQIQDAGFDAVA